MKKKVLILLLIPVMLLTITACGNKKKEEVSNKKTIILEDTKLGFKTTFTFDASKNYTDIEEDDEGVSKEISFENEDLDLEFEMYYNTMSNTSYDSSKESRSEQKYYKEYKFGDYEAYAYGNYESGLYLNVLLNTEDNNMVDVLFVSIDRMDNNQDVIVSNVIDSKEVQDFFNSMKFEKIKK